MTLLTYCIPCASGFHDEHHEMIRPAPEDGVGGAMCPCKGECVEEARHSPDPAVRAMMAALDQTPPIVWRCSECGYESHVGCFASQALRSECHADMTRREQEATQ